MQGAWAGGGHHQGARRWVAGRCCHNGEGEGGWCHDDEELEGGVTTVGEDDGGQARTIGEDGDVAGEGGAWRRRWGSKAYGPGCGGGTGDRRQLEKTKACVCEADLGDGVGIYIGGTFSTGLWKDLGLKNL
jgi:hypothetical protein